MEEILKRELNTSSLKCLGESGGGCINQGLTYQTDSEKIFVKVNTKPAAKQMFDGEFSSLELLSAADIVKVPQPIKVLSLPGGGAVFAMEYLNISSSLMKHAKLLGEQLARLHLLNEEVGKKIEKKQQSVHTSEEYKFESRFGFPVTTCCGFIAQDNTWDEDWLAFYARKIECQLELIEREYGDRSIRELWSRVLCKLPALFKDLDIKPALLHGDLWGGNVGENEHGPVIFDPASFYGHHEFDLSISKLFGGFPGSFFESYHSLIPKAPGYASRLELYKFFHYVNHWNHFGVGYKSSTMRSLRALVKEMGA